MNSKLLVILFSSVLLFIIIATALGLARNRSGQSDRDFRVPVKEISGPTSREEKFIHGPGDYGRELNVDRRSRYYELHVPSSYNRSKAVPVVLVFHGGGGDPGSVRYESGMDSISDREGFIVVYAAGTNNRLVLKNRLLLWNDGRPDKDGKYSKVDDVRYVVALLDDLGILFNIDRMRTYACGYSNGAQFTYRLAKRLSNRIVAVAAVAGNRPAKDDYDPLPSRPISIMQFSGKEDPISPYHGGRPPGAAALTATIQPVNDTIKSWVDFNKCPAEPSESKRIGKAVMNRWGPCQGETEVVLWTLDDGGHTWPGGRVPPGVEKLGLGRLGNVNHDINASELMWQFFKRQMLV